MNPMNSILRLINRWRVSRAIDAGGPMPASLRAAIERSPGLRAHADAMRRVHDALARLDDAADRPASPMMVSRVLERIESIDAASARPAGPRARLRPLLWAPALVAAAAVLLATFFILPLRPDGDDPTPVAGDLSWLPALLSPESAVAVPGWVDDALSEELDALARDARDIAQGMLGDVPGSDLVVSVLGGRSG